MFKRGLIILVLLVASVGFLTAEGGAEKKSVTVGAKNFTEQYIMGEMIVDLLEARGGFSVKYDSGMSSSVVRSALETEQIDMYADYTGTAWTVYLNHEDVISDPVELYEAVKEEDLEKNGIVWLDMIPVNNTYALAVKQEFAAENDLETLGDLASLVNQNPGDYKFAIDFEFFNRPDGFPAMAEAYGLDYQENNVSTMEIGLTYEAIDQGDVDIAMVFATDGRLKKFNLTVLEDNKNFFPPYNLAVCVNKDVLDQYPEIEDALAPLADILDAETMQNLNYQVDAQRQEPESVAEAFLKEQGLIE